MGEGAGRPTDLTDEMVAKIKDGILNGLTLVDIAKQSGISEFTIHHWSSANYAGISDKIEVWKHERMLRLAEITSNKIQTLPVEDEHGKLDKELLKIKQKEAEFIRETLGKNNYHRKTATDITSGGQKISGIGTILTEIEEKNDNS
jgi:hypothetical protein